MESNKQSDAYEREWHPNIEQVLSENTSKFFRDYLQYKTASSLKFVNDNNTKELYQQFKDFVKSSFENHNEFISDIVRLVKCYKWIITEVVNDSISSNNSNDREIKELLRNIFHDIKAEAFKPFVLGLLEYHQYTINESKLRDETLIGTLRTIRTYLIRRRILGLTQGENKYIVTLSKEIVSISKEDVSMLELLTDVSYRLRLPNDNDMKDALTSINFYEGLKSYSKFILGKIEESKTKVSVDFRDKKITIEHIMPQTLDHRWKEELGDNFNELHGIYLHNIGNLILTEFNSEIGNKSFEEKKKKLKESSLNYRLDVMARNIWNEESIIQHRSNMIKGFLSTFSLPDNFKQRNNWNNQKNDNTSFSPLDLDAGEIADGNKPIELHIYKEIIKVQTWQDVFIEFLKYLKDKPDFDFEFIFDNQVELFKRDETIIKWSSLKQLIDAKPVLSNKYKTFEGKVWDKVKELNDDLIFIHTHINARTCMTRIGNVMEKFNIAQDAVKIEIKLKD